VAAKGFAKHKQAAASAGAAVPFNFQTRSSNDESTPAARAQLVPTGFAEAFGTVNGENRCAVNVAVAAANSVLALVPPSLPDATAARAWAHASVDPFLKFTPPTEATEFPCALQMIASVFAAADVELECVPVSGPVSPNPSAPFVLQEWPPGAPLNFDPAMRANAVIYSRPGSHFVCAVWSARFAGFFLLDDAVCRFVGPTAPEPPAACWTVAGVLLTRNPGGGASERPRRTAALEEAAQADLAAASALAQSASLSVARLALCARAFATRGALEEGEAASRAHLLASAAALAEKLAEHAPPRPLSQRAFGDNNVEIRRLAPFAAAPSVQKFWARTSAKDILARPKRPTKHGNPPSAPPSPRPAPPLPKPCWNRRPPTGQQF
jgi:hypothetical protein